MWRLGIKHLPTSILHTVPRSSLEARTGSLCELHAQIVLALRHTSTRKWEDLQYLYFHFCHKMQEMFYIHCLTQHNLYIELQFFYTKLLSEFRIKIPFYYGNKKIFGNAKGKSYMGLRQWVIKVVEVPPPPRIARSDMGLPIFANTLALLPQVLGRFFFLCVFFPSGFLFSFFFFYLFS